MAALTLEQALQTAIAQHQAGNLAAAEAIYRQILAVQPDHVDALHLLGAVALVSARCEEAVERIERAVALSPGNPIYESNLGEAYRRLGRFEEAITHLRQAVDLQPDNPNAWNNLGSAFAGQERLDEAIACFQSAAALRPAHVGTQNNLALAFTKQGRHAEAITCYQHVAALLPDSAPAQNNLAQALLEERRWDEAMACCHRALALDPNSFQARGNLAIALLRTGRHKEALACNEEALALIPNSVDLHASLAVALLAGGEYERAQKVCESALAIDPDCGSIHFIHAEGLLRDGRFEEGWREYEWRWQCRPLCIFRRRFPVPQWDGTPAPGKTILAHAEQGYGDALQFLRYVQLLRERVGSERVIVECGGPLVRLIAAALGEGAAVFPRTSWDGRELPPFDYHIPWHSLPLALGVFAPLPMEEPYLQIDPRLQADWRERLRPYSTLRIGLAWAGNPNHPSDYYRSLAPEKLLPLLRLPGVSFHSLQIEPRNASPSVLHQAGLIDHTAYLTDFLDTAALMAELDLIISVDSAIAHLAGALGHPVWTLLPFASDWRWGIEGESTPWYPTMRLFRQSAIGDWDTVLRRVQEELQRGELPAQVIQARNAGQHFA